MAFFQFRFRESLLKNVFNNVFSLSNRVIKERASFRARLVTWFFRAGQFGVFFSYLAVGYRASFTPQGPSTPPVRGCDFLHQKVFRDAYWLVVIQHLRKQALKFSLILPAATSDDEILD